jgi:hypothetical protein
VDLVGSNRPKSGTARICITVLNLQYQILYYKFTTGTNLRFAMLLGRSRISHHNQKFKKTSENRAKQSWISPNLQLCNMHNKIRLICFMHPNINSFIQSLIDSLILHLFIHLPIYHPIICPVVHLIIPLIMHPILHPIIHL